MNRTHPPLHVLVIDDDSLMRWAVAGTLGDCGHDVWQADDGAAAIELLTQAPESPDVVLLSGSVVEASGPGLLLTLRCLVPDAAVVLTSTRDELAAALREADDGVTLLQKPFDMIDLEPVLYDAAQMQRVRLRPRTDPR